MLKVFEYFDAHRVPTRVMHERNRGWQRFLIAMFMPPLALLGNQESSAAHRLAVAIALASAAYGLASLVYLAYLRRRPTGAVAVQYLFTVSDPLFILMVFMQDPRFFAFALPLLVVIITRSGMRYGVSIAWLTWAAACVWYLVLLPFTPNLHSHLPLLLAVPITLVFLPSLIWPSIRQLQAARALEAEQARVAALSQAATARSAFVATVSHELRSPLQSVIWALDAFEKHGVRNAAQSDFVKTMRRSVNLLTRQLRDMLTLERSESGQLEVYPSAFDFCALVEDVGAAHRDLAATKGLALSIHLPDETLFVVADSSRIDQVLTNLVANAIRYTDTGQVHITLEPYHLETKTVRFSVSDTGRGIPEGMQDVIFQRH
ncbi:MAG: HAMP domain-containing sensor histidine kinase, partial [Planctomycetota bacterium]